MRTLKIGLAQMALEGDLDGNHAKIARLIHQARTDGCRAVVFTLIIQGDR
jgi:predicted amidohydrolase